MLRTFSAASEITQRTTVQISNNTKAIKEKPIVRVNRVELTLQGWEIIKCTHFKG